MRTTVRNVALVIAILAIVIAIALFIMLINRSNQLPTSTPNSPTEANSTPSLMPLALTPTVGPQLLHADFEQSGAIIGRLYDGDWSTKVVDGNGLLVVSSAPNGGPGNLPSIDFGSGAWTDYVTNFRFKVTECNPTGFFGCMVIITFRNEPEQAYVLEINAKSGEVRLEFGGRGGWIAINKGITDRYLDLSQGTWHDVLLTANRDVISASIDGKEAIAVTDDRLKSGAIAFIVGASTTAEFDDLNIWSIP